METRSVIRVDLFSEKSAMFAGGPMMMFRPALPNVPVAGRAKAVVLNPADLVCCPPALGSPTRLGRAVSSPVPLRAAPKKGVGGRAEGRAGNGTTLQPSSS